MRIGIGSSAVCCPLLEHLALGSLSLSFHGLDPLLMSSYMVKNLQLVLTGERRIYFVKIKQCKKMLNFKTKSCPRMTGVWTAAS